MMTPQEYKDALMWRYACKKFDPAARIAPATWDALEEAFHLAPSSLGLQLWHFIVVDDREIREKLCEASFNQTQVRDASKYVVLCARRDVQDSDLLAHINRAHEVLNTSEERMQSAYAKYKGYSVFWQGDEGKSWMESQVHLAAGFVAAAAACLHVDTCIMGGIVPVKYDEILGLEDSPYRTVLGMAFGYRSPEDAHALEAKVRYPKDKVISHC